MLEQGGWAGFVRAADTAEGTRASGTILGQPDYKVRGRYHADNFNQSVTGQKTQIQRCRGTTYPMRTQLKFSINRISASTMAFTAFAAMAQRLGVQTIEIRNDLAGVELKDGTGAAELGAIVVSHGLTIRSINALQRFDQFDAVREAEARDLAAYAARCGAQSLVLCPTNSRQDQRSPAQRHDDLVDALRRLGPLLAEHGITGLLEPLGFEECAMRCKSQAVAAMQDCGQTELFALVHDTFHHHLAGDPQLYPASTGLVHISGVEDPALAASGMRDGHRVLVGPADRLDNLGQLRALLAAGYRGVASFEPFATEVATAPDIELRLRRSMDYLSDQLVAPVAA